MPRSRSVRSTRTAISPRLATRTERKGVSDMRLQGDVAVLLGRVGVALALEHLQRGDQAGAGFGRLDPRIDEAARGGDVGVGQAFAVLRLQAFAGAVRVVGFGDLVA